MKIIANNIELFYVKSGVGERSVVLLHGNGESHAIFDVARQKMEQDFVTYALDSRKHGCSASNVPLDYYAMSEDVAQFITTLGIKKPILLGFSDGAIIGLILASKYPDMLSHLIACGANSSPSGLNNFCRWQMRLAHLFTRSPFLNLMLTQPPLTRELLARITVPTTIVAGSRDLIKPSDMHFIASSIRNAKLKILQGHTHASYIINSPVAADLCYDVLNAEAISKNIVT